MSEVDIETRLARVEDGIRRIKFELEELASTKREEIRRELEDRAFSIAAQIRIEDRVFSQIPVLEYTCRPNIKTEMKGLFGGRQQAIVRLFEEPTPLREHGFGLISGGRVSVNVGGEYRLISIGGYQSRFLSREGIIGTIVSGTEDFMAWALPSNVNKTIRINPVPFTELTYDFCRVATKILQYAEPKVEKATFRLRLVGFDETGHTLSLPRGRMSNMLYVSSNPPTILGKTDQQAIEEVQIDEEPGKIAFKLIASIYSKFGYDADTIPYAEDGTLDIRSIVPDLSDKI